MSPEHINDPEIRELPPSVQKSLRGLTLLAKTPLESLSATRTRMGFLFESTDGLSLTLQRLLPQEEDPLLPQRPIRRHRGCLNTHFTLADDTSGTKLLLEALATKIAFTAAEFDSYGER